VATCSNRCSVLLTFAGRKAYVYQILSRSPRAGRIIAVDADENAAVREYTRSFHVVPRVRERAAYVETLLGLCTKFAIDCLIPLNDLDLAVLAENASQFLAIGTRVLGASADTVALVTDKLAIGEWLRARGFSYPDTEAFSPGTAIPRSFTLPLVAKSRFGQASEGLQICRSVEDLSRLTSEAVLQPFLDGPEFNLDILCAASGEVIAVVPKLKLEMRYGSTDKARSVRDPTLIDLGVRLGDAIGHVGSIDVDVIVSQGNAYVIDVNPRIGGGFPFTAHFCPAYVDALLAIGLGESPPQILGSYRKDVTVYRDFHFFESGVIPTRQ